MAVLYGLEFQHQSSGSGKPHIFSYLTSRSVADDGVFEVWNGATNSDRIFRLTWEGQLQVENGTAAKPSYSFDADKDSGRYMSGAGTFLDVVAGTAVGTWTAGKLALAGDLEVGDDVTLKSDAAVLNFGADSDVSLTHVADTGLLLNSTRQLQFNDSSQYINAPSATVLDINATDEIELNATLVDVNANLEVSGTAAMTGVVTFTATPVFSSDLTIEDDLYLDSDAAVIHLGEDGDVTLTHVADTGILLNSTMQLQFNDASQYISGASATKMVIAATDEVEINATAVDLNGTLDVSGTSTLTGNVTMSADASVGDDLTLVSDAAVLNFGADSDVSLTHVADTGLLLNSTRQLQFNDSSQYISGTSATVLSIAATDEIDLTATAVDLNGTLDVSGTSTLTGNVTMSADASVGDDLTLGSDAAVLNFGADSDVSLTHVADTALLLNSTRRIQFYDSSQYIGASSAADLDIAATTDVNIDATTLDVNAAINVSGVSTLTGNVTMSADASVGDDLTLVSDAAVLNFGADSDVNLTHVADTGLLLNSTMALQFNDASQYINAPSATVLDINATDEIELNATAVDLNGTLDVSGTSLLTGNVTMSADASVGDDLSLVSDAAVLNFGGDSEINLTHVHDTGLLLNSTSRIQFNDSSQYIGASSGADLDIAATTDINLNCTTVDVNAALTVSGTSVLTGNVTISGDLTVDGTTTTINSTTISVDDKNIELGSVASPSDSTADGGGITLKGASDKTILWENDTDSWDFNQHVSLKADAAVLAWGADRDVTLTHVADTGLLLNSTRQLQFNDASQYISGASATKMIIAATDEVEINVTLVDVNANLDVSGTLAVAGTMTAVAADFSGNVTSAHLAVDAGGQLNLDGSTSGNTYLYEQSADTVWFVVGANVCYTQTASATTFAKATTFSSTLAVTGDASILNGSGLVVGHTAIISAADATPELQLLGTATADSTMLIGQWSATANAASIRFYKSRNGTIGSNTTVVSGDDLASIQVYADDGSDANTLSSAIVFDSEGTISTGQVPGIILFQTAAAGTLANVLTLDSSKLATFSGNVSLAATKKLYFDGGSDTYIYESAANQMVVVVDDSTKLIVTTTLFEIQNNHFSIPTTKNFYLDGGGDTYLTESSNVISVTTANVLSVQFREQGVVLGATKKLYLDGYSNTYIHEVSSDVIRFTVGDRTVVDIGEGGGGLNDYLAIQAANRFYLDGVGNTYITESAADTVQVYAGGGAALTLTDATGPHAIGAAVDTRVQLNIAGAFTAAAVADRGIAVSIGTDLTGAAGQTNRLTLLDVGSGVGGSITTQSATEDIAVIATAYFAEPNITNSLGGSNVPDVAATVYVKDAPSEGTANAALYVAAGGSIFLGDLRMGGYSSTVSHKLFFADTGGDEWGINYDAGAGGLEFEESGVANNRVVFADGGTVHINDTANANMTIGLTINQGGNDTQAFCLKSSDVGHGLTTGTPRMDVEVDDYFTLSKHSEVSGGLHFQVLGEDSTNITSCLEIMVAGGQAQTTDITSSVGLVNIAVAEHDGSNAFINAPANQNIFVVAGWTSGAQITHMIVKGDDGELHVANTTLVALDSEDDIGLVRAMQYEASGGKGMNPTPWNTEDYGVPAFSHEKLMAVGVLGEKDVNGRCLMRVQPRFAMNEGAIWQNHVRHMELVNCLRSLVEANPHLEGRDTALALLEAN